jgi:hypothetical protein
MRAIEKAIGTNIDSDGNICWPDTVEARNELASELFGAKIATNLDYWIEHSQERIRNPIASNQFKREHVNWEKDEPLRKAFSEMTPDQRHLVEQLVWKTATGLLFSTLSDLDQFPGGIIDMHVLDADSGEKLASITEAGSFELHDRFYNWLSEYSRLASDYDPSLQSNED